jgi:putative transposase
MAGVWNALKVLDDCSKESVAIIAGTSIPRGYVTGVLHAVALGRKRSGVSKQGDGVWAYHNGVALRFIHPGKPIQNAYIESFNGRQGLALERAMVHEHGTRSCRDRPAA